MQNGKSSDIVITFGSVVAIVGGLYLVVRGIMDIIGALGKGSKDWKSAGIGLGVAIIGGAIIAMGINGFKSFADDTGKDFKIS